MVTKLRLEALTEDRLGDVQRLHHEVFRSRLSLEDLCRKYDTRWAGPSAVGIVAYLGNHAVGFYGALPQRFRRGDSTWIAAQGADAMLVAGLRRRGLHQVMAHSCYDTLRSLGLPFVYGFYSEDTQRVCPQLGWLPSHQLERFVVTVSTPPIASLAARVRAVQRVWETWWRRVCRSLACSPDDFRNSFAETDRMHVDYAPDYLAYRSFSPNTLLRLGTAIAWVRGGGASWVGDLVAPDDEAHDRAVEALIALARRVGSRRLVFQTSPGGPLARRLRRRFEAREGFPIGYLPLTDGVDVSSWGCNLGDLDTF